ncbi:glycine zipper 2TM domain-containing protein [Noviherbaspirillum sp. UKPF54]|nr:glycine zipper 2TM domain-containing protein [Noviherbaspirillum sp. UKPF54]
MNAPPAEVETTLEFKGKDMLRKILSTGVIAALPLMAAASEYQIVERPRQECWNEQVAVQSGGQGYGGAIVGGIAGGLLGNQVGGGNGKTVATAVGAATGAVVGDRMAAQGAPQGTSYRTVQRCRTVVERVRVPVEREGGRFCPPGQAKKGNC